MAALELGGLRIGDREVTLSPVPLPVIYFDGAPALSHMNGVIEITLAVTGNLPMPDGSVTKCASVVAHLKCNIPAAHSLIDALHHALLAAAPVENPNGPTN